MGGDWNRGFKLEGWREIWGVTAKIKGHLMGSMKA